MPYEDPTLPVVKGALLQGAELGINDPGELSEAFIDSKWTKPQRDRYRRSFKAHAKHLRKLAGEQAEEQRKAAIKTKHVGEALGVVPPVVRDVIGGVTTGAADVLGMALRAYDPEFDQPGGQESIAGTLGRKAQELEAGLASAGAEGFAGVLQTGLRGGVRSITTMAPLAATGAGPFGIIGGFATSRGNQAITEARDAGLVGPEADEYVGRAALIEGGIAGAFQLIPGMGGVAGGAESAFAKTFSGDLLKGTIGKETVGRLLLGTFAELTEENLTEFADAYNQARSGVSEPLTAEQAKELFIQTSVTTAMTMGMIGGTGAARTKRTKDTIVKGLQARYGFEKAKAKGLVESAAKRAGDFQRNLGREIRGEHQLTFDSLANFVIDDLPAARAVAESPSRANWRKAGFPRRDKPEREAVAKRVNVLVEAADEATAQATLQEAIEGAVTRVTEPGAPQVRVTEVTEPTRERPTRGMAPETLVEPEVPAEVPEVPAEVPEVPAEVPEAVAPRRRRLPPLPPGLAEVPGERTVSQIQREEGVGYGEAIKIQEREAPPAQVPEAAVLEELERQPVEAPPEPPKVKISGPKRAKWRRAFKDGAIAYDGENYVVEFDDGSPSQEHKNFQGAMAALEAAKKPAPKVKVKKKGKEPAPAEVAKKAERQLWTGETFERVTEEEIDVGLKAVNESLVSGEPYTKSEINDDERLQKSVWENVKRRRGAKTKPKEKKKGKKEPGLLDPVDISAELRDMTFKKEDEKKPTGTLGRTLPMADALAEKLRKGHVFTSSEIREAAEKHLPSGWGPADVRAAVRWATVQAESSQELDDAIRDATREMTEEGMPKAEPKPKAKLGTKKEGKGSMRAGWSGEGKGLSRVLSLGNTGWRVIHAGHPTALRPWYVESPDVVTYAAWSHVADAQKAVEMMEAGKAAGRTPSIVVGELAIDKKRLPNRGALRKNMKAEKRKAVKEGLAKIDKELDRWERMTYAEQLAELSGRKAAEAAENARNSAIHKLILALEPILDDDQNVLTGAELEAMADKHLGDDWTLDEVESALLGAGGAVSRVAIRQDETLADYIRRVEDQANKAYEDLRAETPVDEQLVSFLRANPGNSFSTADLQKELGLKGKLTLADIEDILDGELDVVKEPRERAGGPRWRIAEGDEAVARETPPPPEEPPTPPAQAAEEVEPITGEVKKKARKPKSFLPKILPNLDKMGEEEVIEFGLSIGAAPKRVAPNPATTALAIGAKSYLAKFWSTLTLLEGRTAQEIWKEPGDALHGYARDLGIANREAFRKRASKREMARELVKFFEQTEERAIGHAAFKEIDAELKAEEPGAKVKVRKPKKTRTQRLVDEERAKIEKLLVYPGKVEDVEKLEAKAAEHDKHKSELARLENVANDAADKFARERKLLSTRGRSAGKVKKSAKASMKRHYRELQGRVREASRRAEDFQNDFVKPMQKRIAKARAASVLASKDAPMISREGARVALHELDGEEAPEDLSASLNTSAEVLLYETYDDLEVSERFALEPMVAAHAKNEAMRGAIVTPESILEDAKLEARLAPYRLRVSEVHHFMREKGVLTQQFNRHPRAEIAKVEEIEEILNEEPSRLDVARAKQLADTEARAMDDREDERRAAAEVSAMSVREELAQQYAAIKDFLQGDLSGRLGELQERGQEIAGHLAGEAIKGELDPQPIQKKISKPKDRLQAIKSHAHKEPTRYAMHGVRVDTWKGNKVAVATDGKRLIVVPYEGELGEGTWRKQPKKKGKGAVLGAGKVVAGYEEIEGVYPPFNEVIPDRVDYENTVKVTDELTNKLRGLVRANKVAAGIGRKAGLSSEQNAFVYLSYEEGKGFAVQAQFVLDAIESLTKAGHQPTELAFKNNVKNALLVLTEDEGALALVMPINLYGEEELPANERLGPLRITLRAGAREATKEPKTKRKVRKPKKKPEPEFKARISDTVWEEVESSASDLMVQEGITYETIGKTSYLVGSEKALKDFGNTMLGDYDPEVGLETTPAKLRRAILKWAESVKSGKRVKALKRKKVKGFKDDTAAIPSEGAMSVVYRGEAEPSPGQQELFAESVTMNAGEMVRLLKVAGADVPKIMPKLAGRAVGKFRTLGNESLGIFLDKHIFLGPVIRTGTVKADDVAEVQAELIENVLEEFPDLEEGDVVPKVTNVPNNTRLKRITIYRKDPKFASKVLAHEIGHWVDFMPEGQTGRGNILGRLATLRRYLKSTLEEGGGVGASKKAMARLRKAAERDVGPTEAKKGSPEHNAWRKEVSDRRDELARQAGLLLRADVESELKALTRWWNPFDPDEDAAYTKYRHSSPELYAEALSVLLNEPASLKERAPLFYATWHNLIERKPNVAAAYKHVVREVVSGVAASKMREAFRVDMALGEDAARRNAEARKLTRDVGTVVGTAMIDKFWRLHRLVAAAKKAGRTFVDPRHWIDAAKYVGAMIEEYERRNHIIFEELKRKNLSQEDFGEYLFFMRAIRGIGEAGEKAIPHWGDLAGAQKGFAEMQRQMGPDKMDTLEKARKDYRQLREELVLRKVAESGIYDEKFTEFLLDNEFYSRFEVVKYMERRMGKGHGLSMPARDGTFEGISNSWSATMEFDMRLLTAVNWNHAKQATVDFLQQSGVEGAAQPAKTAWDGKRQAPVEPTDPNLGLVTFMRDGKMEGYYVDRYVAGAFSPDGEITRALAGVMRFFATPARVWFTAARPGFQVFNALFRDPIRTIVNIPEAGKHPLAIYKGIINSGIAVFKEYRDEVDPVLTEMRERGLLISWGIVSDVDEGTSRLERFLARHRDSGTWGEFVKKPFTHLVSRLLVLSALGETANKRAAYVFIKKNQEKLGWSDGEVDHAVRHWAGSPSFITGGRMTPLTNNVLLFSNAAIQGYRSDVEAFRADPIAVAAKRVGYAIMPKMIALAFATGAIGWLLRNMGADEDDEGIAGQAVRFADDQQAILSRVSEYDLANYTVVPLGLTEDGKAVYLRLPQDETDRVIGGGFVKLFTGGDWLDAIQRAVSFGNEQMPGWNPAYTLASEVLEYLSGGNPYDSFRGRHAVPPEVALVGGEQSHKAFAKWLHNRYGGSFIYKFASSNPADVETRVEELLRGEGLAKIVGPDVFNRFIRISDYGLIQKAQRSRDEARRDRARDKAALSRAVKASLEGELGEDDRQLLLDYPREARRVEETLQRRRTALGRALAGAQSRAETAAVLRTFAETAPDSPELEAERRDYLKGELYRLTSPSTGDEAEAWASMRELAGKLTDDEFREILREKMRDLEEARPGRRRRRRGRRVASKARRLRMTKLRRGLELSQ